ncbi:hypothetical protein Gocc_2923 [Gaiella occulta]|uniref:Holin n=1 Tax=Gaiella occulta TaxID=1002870 RepID=A0A7M2YT97_9ACTN|nr:holin [Gaiella occulta]RDI73323.1 hypothetical protein Gocc_2923 [Gaiella occulta]
MMSRRFLRDLAERALKTFVQTTITGALVLLTVDGASWSDVPGAAAAGAFAGTLSALTSILSSLRGNPDSASFVE